MSSTKRHKPPKVDATRSHAFAILNALENRGQTLDTIFEEFDRTTPLEVRDRAFLNTLVYGVLRWRRRLDATLAEFSSVPIEKIDPKVLNILRLGLFQMRYLDRIPPSAAVNTSVELCKSVAAPWIVKFVNAILRKLATTASQATLNTALSLAVETSLPDWLVSRWTERFGEKESRALCQSINEIPPTTIRANTLKCSRGELKQTLSAEVAAIWETRYAPDGISFTGPQRPINQLSAFPTGGFQVQDEAAQLATRLLSPKPGETILDACAGLGGKTGYLAQLMNNQGRIIAMDVHSDKLKKLMSEMNRLGVKIVETIAADINDVRSLETLPTFDRILLDAPCSGIGVIRRNPDTRWFFTEQDIARCRKRQGVFLNLLSSRVTLGGVLMYIVCSTEPEENERVVNDFLAAYPNFVIEPLQGGETIPPGFFTEQGFFRSFPHRDNMDGFFAALFRRRA